MSQTPWIITSLTLQRLHNGFSHHRLITITTISLRFQGQSQELLKWPTIFHLQKPIGWPMLPTRKTINLKTWISNLKALKLSISERRDQYGCGHLSELSPWLSSDASSSFKDGQMRITIDIKEHHHSCTQMRTILLMSKIF